RPKGEGGCYRRSHGPPLLWGVDEQQQHVRFHFHSLIHVRAAAAPPPGSRRTGGCFICKNKNQVLTKMHLCYIFLYYWRSFTPQIFAPSRALSGRCMMQHIPGRAAVGNSVSIHTNFSKGPRP